MPVVSLGAPTVITDVHIVGSRKILPLSILPLGRAFFIGRGNGSTYNIIFSEILNVLLTVLLNILLTVLLTVLITVLCTVLLTFLFTISCYFTILLTILFTTLLAVHGALVTPSGTRVSSIIS